ncbi:hypothetical protein DL93DRAFT_375960 [Clavulina sp. PMI_390]|nr:hypothetical protein DL93DRAFT_375960 [Clavulina sp. PMI_390]
MNTCKSILKDKSIRKIVQSRDDIAPCISWMKEATILRVLTVLGLQSRIPFRPQVHIIREISSSFSSRQTFERFNEPCSEDDPCLVITILLAVYVCTGKEQLMQRTPLNY